MEIRKTAWLSWWMALWGSLLFGVLSTGWVVAQARPQRSNQAASSSAATEQEVAATRLQLYKLLRMSPKLTTVVARDPSLLADREYVDRNNPELGQFLQDHPEVARNPEFYLFANPGNENGENQELDSGRRELLFEHAVWPELSERERQVIREQSWRRSRGDTSDLLAFAAFIFVLGALLWLTRVWVQNRRWGKIFKVQTDTYGKLLEKFSTSTNEELLAYVRSDTGKRFLESASLPINPDPSPQMGGLWSRVMGSLQLGIVLTPVGIGLLSLRNRLEDPVPLLVFGTLGLALGIGFIISAGFSFALGRHLKLLPKGNSSGENVGMEVKD
jgi:hypothetical protein